MTIRQYIDILIEKEIQRLDSNKDPFLMKGDMGVIVFLSYMFGKTNDFKYIDRAKALLDSLSEKISNKSLLEIYNGVSGIGLAVLLLHCKGVIEENPDKILKNIDEYIYRKSVTAVYAYEQKYENTYLDILLYISIRFQYCQNQEDKDIFCRLWFALYNKLYLNLTPDFFIEPIPSVIKYKMAQFILVSALGVKLDIKFKDRISKIFKEISNYIFSYYPQLHFNRLILFAALKQLRCVVDLDEKWIDYQDRLFASISIKKIIKKEILPNDLYLSHGLPCLYFLLKILGFIISDEIVEMMINKVKVSNMVKFDYAKLTKFNFVGLDGIFSVISMLIELKPDLLYGENRFA